LQPSATVWPLPVETQPEPVTEQDCSTNISPQSPD
jgi:hypothetical protein